MLTGRVFCEQGSCVEMHKMTQRADCSWGRCGWLAGQLFRVLVAGCGANSSL